ncbi:MAG: hypothetical protein QOD66_89 [Solirubrobacteraceae bacterium]|nr:hypothetical protein [Solirubrobacteraceae bacterium]
MRESRRRWPRTLCCAACLAAIAPPALAADPGRWAQSSQTTLPLYYYQGVTSDARANFFFNGIHFGLYRSNTELPFTSDVRNDDVIPADVTASEGYNHIGDISWDAGEGARVLLPMECYYPVPGRNANTCQTGSIGVADPCTLQWRYYVKLDPTDIKKVMWNEVSPDGTLLWVEAGDGKSSPGGRDLIAYRTSEIRLANAAPGGPALKPVARLRNIVPDSGITGATFYGGLLYVAGQDDPAGFQVWSLDLHTGRRTLEIEKQVVGESEGLDSIEAKGGVLHWLIQPYNTQGPPTFGIANGTLLSFYPRGASPPPARVTQPPSCFEATAPNNGGGQPALKRSAELPHVPATSVSTALPQLQASVRPLRTVVGQLATYTFRVITGSGGRRVVVPGATVRFSGASAVTNSSGVAKITRRWRSRGRRRATVTKRGLRSGRSDWVRVVHRPRRARS